MSRLMESVREGIYAAAFGAFFSAEVRRAIDEERRLTNELYDRIGEDADACAERAVLEADRQYDDRHAETSL